MMLEGMRLDCPSVSDFFFPGPSLAFCVRREADDFETPRPTGARRGQAARWSSEDLASEVLRLVHGSRYKRNKTDRQTGSDWTV